MLKMMHSAYNYLFFKDFAESKSSIFIFANKQGRF